MSVWLSIWAVLWHALFAQSMPFPGPGMAHSVGGTPPTFVSATSSLVSVGAMNVFTFPTITTSSGDMLWLIAGHRTVSDSNLCSTLSAPTSTIGGSGSGDTFTKVPSTNPHGTFDCAISWIAFNVHAGSANYVITVQGDGSQSTLAMSLMRFTPGSLTAVDTTCTNYSASGTTLSCSSAMTPATSLELVMGGIFAYDATTVTAGSGYTIPSGGTSSTGPSSGVEYQIANPTSGTYTPSFSNTGAGDNGTIIGVLVK